MNQLGNVKKATDSIQERLTQYAIGLEFKGLSAEAVHAAKVRVIDTLGVLIGGFFGEPCRVARAIAAAMPNGNGATVIGTRMRTTPDMAAFVNGTTARYAEFNDLYHWPGSRHGHPSDVISPLLAVAEHVHSTGRDFITAVVLAYEVYARFCDAVRAISVDNSNYCCFGGALGAGKLLRLTPAQLGHCISMAIVPNVILNQVRESHKSHYKVAAAGHGGRAAVFAAMLARAGMEGPHLPFEGKAGWCDVVAGKRLAFDTLGGDGIRFKIVDSRTRHRPAMGETHAAIIAAEKIAPKLNSVADISAVTVETYERARELVGSRKHVWCWDPQSPESADQSIPYLVAITLRDGTVTPRSFTERDLTSPEVRALMEKIEVVENEAFTKAFNLKVARPDPSLDAYERLPREHWTRVTVVANNGERWVAESGGDVDDLSVQKNDAQIEAKFRTQTEDLLGTQQVNAILDRLWNLESMDDAALIAPLFALD